MAELFTGRKVLKEMPESLISFHPRAHKFTMIPSDQFIPLTQRLIEGNLIHWNDPTATNEIRREISRPYTVVGRLVSSMLLSPGAESSEAFRMLARDLRDLSGEDKPIMHSDHLQEWWYKLVIGIQSVSIVEAVGVKDKTAKAYYDTVDDNVRLLAKELRNLKLDDLSYYLRFIDLYTGVTFEDSVAEGAMAEQKKHLVSTEDSLKDLIMDSSAAGWSRLKVGWGWDQVAQVLEELPHYHANSIILACTISALETNLVESGRKLGNIRPAAFNIGTQGVMELLRFKWTDPGIPGFIFDKELSPEFINRLESALEFPGFSVPRKYLPSAAIELLIQTPGAINEVHRLAAADKEVASAWFTTLLAIRFRRPDLAVSINGLVDNWQGLHPSIRETFLDRIPGRLRLGNGKLQRTGVDKKLRFEFPLYTSALPEKVLTEELIVADPGVVESGVESLSGEVHSLPFIGEVRIMSEGMVGVINSLFDRSYISREDEENLLEDFDRLQREWRNQYRPGQRLYITKMNIQDAYIQKAAKMGVKVVYLEGQNVVFIFDEVCPKGIAGSIDNNGQLHILGMDDSFLGEPEQIVLNNIALHLATQKLYRIGFDKFLDTKILSPVHEIEATWNRTMRGSLPKIGTSENGVPAIPMRIAGFETPVFFAQVVSNSKKVGKSG